MRLVYASVYSSLAQRHDYRSITNADHANAPTEKTEMKYELASQ
jgi:hypothetical protein